MGYLCQSHREIFWLIKKVRGFLPFLGDKNKYQTFVTTHDITSNSFFIDDAMVLIAHGAALLLQAKHCEVTDDTLIYI